MYETTVEIDGRRYWVSTITGEVISKELVPERRPSMSETRESVFLIDGSGKERSVEMEVLTSEFRRGSTISLIYLAIGRVGLAN